MGQDMNSIRGDSFRPHPDSALSLRQEANRHVGEGNRLDCEGKYEEAIIHYNQAIRMFPRDFEAIYNRADTYFRCGKADLALIDFSHILHHNERHIVALNYRGTCYAKLKKYSLSIRDWKNCLLLYPSHVICLFNLAELHFVLGEFDATIHFYSMLIRVVNQPFVMYMGGDIMMIKQLSEEHKIFREKRQHVIKAKIEIAKNTIILRRNNIEDQERRELQIFPIYQKAKVYLDLGMFDYAIKQFRLSIHYGECLYLSHIGIGKAMVGKRNLEEALRSFESAINDSPDLFDAYEYQGKCLLEMGEFSRAERSFKKSLSINPNNSSTHFFLGITQSSQNRTRSASSSYDKSRDLEISRNLESGLMNLHIGKHIDCQAFFTNVLNIDPDHTIAAEGLVVSYTALKKFDEVLKVFEFLIQRQPNNIRAIYLRGLFYQREMLNIEQALNDYKRVTLTMVEDSDERLIYSILSYFNMGLIYRKNLFDYEKAIECFTLAIVLINSNFEENDDSVSSTIVFRNDLEKTLFVKCCNSRGLCYMDQRKLDLCLKDFEQSIRYGNSEYVSKAYNNRGVALTLLNHPEEAFESFQRGIECLLENEDRRIELARMYNNRGFINEIMGRFLEAHDDYSIASKGRYSNYLPDRRIALTDHFDHANLRKMEVGTFQPIEDISQIEWMEKHLTERRKKSLEGVKCSDFKFIREIGAGSQCRCYLCQLKKTKELFVVKIFFNPYDLEDEKGILDLFGKEVIFDYHPNTISIIHHFVDRLDRQIEILRDFPLNNVPTLFVVMKYFRMNLSQYVKRRVSNNSQLTEIEVLYIMREILRGLVHISERGIVHRDIKGENVFIDEINKRVILADFGLCHDSRTSGLPKFVGHRNLLEGTPGLLAPEVNIEDTNETVDYSRNDVFSTGVLFYNLICSNAGSVEENPWGQGRDRTQLNYRPLHETVISHRIDSVVKRMVMIDPKQRLSCEAAREEVDELIQEYRLSGRSYIPVRKTVNGTGIITATINEMDTISKLSDTRIVISKFDVAKWGRPNPDSVVTYFEGDEVKFLCENEEREGRIGKIFFNINEEEDSIITFREMVKILRYTCPENVELWNCRLLVKVLLAGNRFVIIPFNSIISKAENKNEDDLMKGYYDS